MKLSMIKKAGGLLLVCLFGTPVMAQSFTSDQQATVNLAAELYPDLFTAGSAVRSAQGYTYQSFASGVTVGFKDGTVYVAGGPFGADIKGQGSVSDVRGKLQTLKNSVAITPTADMTSVFNLAAQLYPSLFAGSTASFQTTADGYLYRYNAASGVYAAIKNGIVYVKGGSFGNAYTSVGALNSVLGQLQTAVNGGNSNSGGGTTIPSGNYNLTVTGTVTIAGPIAVSQPFSFTLNGIPAPNVSDQNDIKKAFTDALSNANGVTITNFSYVTKSNTADLVEFDVTVSAQISQSGVNLGYTYALNYKYRK